MILARSLILCALHLAIFSQPGPASAAELPVVCLSREELVPALFFCGILILLVLWLVVRVQRRRVVTGQEGLVGEHGRTLTVVHESGKVFVNGEYWDARADEELPAGVEVEVTGIGEQMRLLVKGRPVEVTNRSQS